MNRRRFIGALAIAGTIPMFAKSTKSFNIKMKGELDDDLIINRHYYNKDTFKSIDCFQMHNFKRSFKMGSQAIRSSQIPGYIKYNKNIPIENNSIVSLFTANEREDRDSRKELSFRTHYKSVPLYINDKELFPSLIPEENDVVGYPTWYLKEELSATNYFMLWENAVVLSSFITHITGEHEIVLMNSKNNIVSSKTIDIKKDTQVKIKFDEVAGKKITKDHIFTEVDNNINLKENDCDDDFIRTNAVTKVMIKNRKGVVFIDLPYPCPYINTYTLKHLG